MVFLRAVKAIRTQKTHGSVRRFVRLSAPDDLRRRSVHADQIGKNVACTKYVNDQIFQKQKNKQNEKDGIEHPSAFSAE